MQDNEENQMEIQGGALPSLNDIISPNTELNPNQVTLENTTKTEIVQPTNIEYTTQSRSKVVSSEPKVVENGSQETTEIKSMYKRENGDNKRYEETTHVKEEPNSTTTMVRKVVEKSQPTTETTYYEKRVVKTTSTTRGGVNPDNQNTRYANVNTNTNNVVRSTGNAYQSSSQTYTRPLPASRGGVDKNNNLRNIASARTPSTNKNDTNQYNRYGGVQNSQNITRTNQQRPQPPKKVIGSQSFAGNKYQPKRPETSNYNRQARSPDQSEIRRKTINRGDPVKNVQITHIIYSSTPRDFHITEHLNTETLETEPIEISKADRAKLQKSGKSSWTTSVQDNIKPIITNLKGKTTVYQHARGIGMTNDRKENINPMFYTSEIKKLDPIIKEKEKEKVEYMTFRNTGTSNTINNATIKTVSNTTRNNYNRGTNSNQQKKSYASNTNQPNNYNRGNKVNIVRTTQSYTRGNNYGTGSGNDGEIVKETRTKVQMGSRSQYRGTGNPTSSVTTEKRVYNSNSFFNNNK